MTDASPSQAAPPAANKREERESLASFAWFCIKLLLVVLIFRSFVFTSFNIPSQSMLPRLLVGDYLFAAKWPYGYSRNSLPFDLPLIPGRIFAHEPERGDVVIFKHPVDKSDYIKRVIGLPGDEVQVISGVVHLNGKPLPLERLSDFVLPLAPGENCVDSSFLSRQGDGSMACVYPRLRETLPSGRSYAVLDLGMQPNDDTAPITVPEGRLFLMGDNRDNSQDSRHPAVAGGWVGLVPQQNLVGRASMVFFSVDGTGELFKPWTWPGAIRWSRIGRTI